MDLTYLKKQADYVSDLDAAAIMQLRCAPPLSDFCGGVFDWSFVRINDEALIALDKLMTPAPIFAAADFDFAPAKELSDFTAPVWTRPYVDLIPLWQRSLARISFGDSDATLPQVLRHAGTSEFWNEFKDTALVAPDTSLAQFLFWEFVVREEPSVHTNKSLIDFLPVSSTPGDLPSLIFAKNAADAAQALSGLSSEKSGALAIGELNVPALITATLFAKEFIGKNGRDFAKLKPEIISGWKNGCQNS